MKGFSLLAGEDGITRLGMFRLCFVPRWAPQVHLRLESGGFFNASVFVSSKKISGAPIFQGAALVLDYRLF